MSVEQIDSLPYKKNTNDLRWFHSISDVIIGDRICHFVSVDGTLVTNAFCFQQQKCPPRYGHKRLYLKQVFVVVRRELLRLLSMKWAPRSRSFQAVLDRLFFSFFFRYAQQIIRSSRLSEKGPSAKGSTKKNWVKASRWSEIFDIKCALFFLVESKLPLESQT